MPVEQPAQPAQFGTTPPVAPAPVAAGGKAYGGRRTKSPSLLPFAIAAGICVFLAGIGLLAFLVTCGDDDDTKKGRQAASTGTAKSTGQRSRSIGTPTKKRTFSRNVVRDRDSQLGRVRTAIDEDDVLATAADPDRVGGDPTWDGDNIPIPGLTLGNDDNAFDGDLPSAADLNMDGTDGAIDSMEPEEGTEEETDEEEPEDRPDPFTDLPDRVGVPKLAGSASGASPTTLGPLHLLESDDVSFSLRHGESALGPRGRFAMERTDESRKARAMLQLGGGKAIPVAQLSVDDDALNFQWLADGKTPEADHLRNCSLLVTVGDQSRAMALREPEVISPWKVDPLKGGGTYERKLDSVPKSAVLGIEILELSDRFPAHTILGGARLQPTKWIPIKMQSSSKAELFTLDVRFRPTKTEKFSLEAKTVWPEGAKFNPKTIRNQMAGLQTRKQTLQAQIQAVPSARRTLTPQITAVDAQLTRYQELQDACDKMTGGGDIHFRVFMHFGGVETDLLTSKAQTTGTADSPAVFSGLEEAAEALDAE